MREEDGMVFAVRRVEADYLHPARFDDMLEVRTQTRGVTGARLIMAQEVWRGERLLFHGRGHAGLRRRRPAIRRVFRQISACSALIAPDHRQPL